MNLRPLVALGLTALGAAGVVAACGDFGSTSGGAQPVADAAPQVDALVAADATPPVRCEDFPVFSSGFDGNSPEEGWSQVLGGQFPVDGGKPDGSASLRVRTSDSYTTSPYALALGLTKIPNVSSAGLA